MARRRNSVTTRHINKSTKRVCPLESDEQIFYFDWVRMMANSDPRFKMIYAIPNGLWIYGEAKSSTKYGLIAKYKKEGVTSGVLDINVDVPQMYLGILRPGMKIEMKRQGKYMTETQAEFAAEAQRFGYICHLCRTGQAAIDRTKEYFGI